MIPIAWLATAISTVFALTLLAKYANLRRPVYLIWALSLLFFAVGSGAEAVARLGSWTESSVKVYYTFGAGLTAGWLGAGTLMLSSPRAGRIGLALVFLISLVIVWQVLATTVETSRLASEGFEALARPPLLRVPVVLMNIAGTLGVLLPTLRSAFRAVRASEPWARTGSLAMIAAGVFVIGGGHSIAGGLRLAPAAAISLVSAVGVTLMFAGFVLPAIDAWLAAQTPAPLRAASPR
ncbi:MAG TPA: hypothetical protein VGR25_03605 [bacterium]|nr:hypothetical protein [bacterium]